MVPTGLATVAPAHMTSRQTHAGPARALAVGLAALAGLLTASIVLPSAAVAQAAGPPTAAPATSTTTTTTAPPSTDPTTAPPPPLTPTSGATTTTSTSTPPGSTTTTLPQIAEGPIPANPPPSTTVPAPSATVPPGQVQALLQGLQGELAQFDAMAKLGPDGIIAVNSATRAAATDAVVAQAQVGVATAGATRDAALQAVGANVRDLSNLAIALYLGEGAAVQNIPDSLDATNQDRQVMLSILIEGSQHKVKSSRQDASVAADGVREATDRLAQAQQTQALAHQAENAANAQLGADKDAALGLPAPTAPSSPRKKKTTAKPTDMATSPTVQGPPVLTAAELAGWFASTGHTANITVPIPELATDYIDDGQSQGVRGDVAFAQSVIETGYFGFPAGGEVAGTDDNFAGIGACDSCTHGWTFPDARTGVDAQLQLLDAYASTTAVATPLIGKVFVAGCCRTWIDLTGVWATNPNYGFEVLSIYKQMVDWALVRRLAVAGLTPSTR
jgi:hypothetical protein